MAERNFVWLEFQDWRDGVIFSTEMEKKGWNNLLRELRSKDNDTVYEDDNRGIQAKVVKYQNKSDKGLIWLPGDADSFTTQWVRKPGAIKHTLVFGKEPGAKWADLMAISGHGSKGRVYGSTYGEFVAKDDRERRWYVAQMMADYTTERGERLKYLLLPCCTNAGIGVAPMWLRMFQNRMPKQVVHGVLGYSQKYSGDDVGANVMRDFVNLLFAGPVKGRERTILECWVQANNKHGEHWGAVMIEDCAHNDTMSRWMSDAGLPAPVGNTVKYYDEYNSFLAINEPLKRDEGIEINDNQPSHKATFFVSKRGDAPDNLQEVDGAKAVDDGFVWLECGNNNIDIDPALGLDPGRGGKLVLTARDGKFEKDKKMTVIFYLYRETHGGVDLPSLLDFRLSPSQKRRWTPLVFANRRKDGSEAGKIDAFHYAFDDADPEAKWELEHGRAELFLQVNPRALDLNKDTSTAGSRGYFWLDVVAPRKVEKVGTSPPVDMPQSASDNGKILSHLRAAIHLTHHGVHLREVKEKDPKKQAKIIAEWSQGWEAVYPKLRAAYESGFKGK